MPPPLQKLGTQPYEVHATWTYNGIGGKRARFRHGLALGCVPRISLFCMGSLWAMGWDAERQHILLAHLPASCMQRALCMLGRYAGCACRSRSRHRCAPGKCCPPLPVLLLQGCHAVV